ncbi:hypothetical protein BVRB_7g166330 [Beta vulgaris subsp. vulgaris]|nr:hypothetical protein BVRB_7g166330 [Beta vulgaris subsp. vulgaris]
MKGYSKIKGNNSFIQRSKSNKEFLFIDKDFELLSSKSINKKTQLVDEQEQSIVDEDLNKNKKNDFLFLGRTEEHEGRGEKIGGVLKRNFSVSSSANCSYQKNNKGNSNNNSNNNNDNNNDSRLERQSSTRAIQDAVKRAFSMKRSSSVNNSDRYCRIYDQPIMSVDDDCDYVNDDECNVTNSHHQEYDCERNRTLNTRSDSMMMKNNQDHHNNGRRHVGSKVMRACKRLFSR